jgi:hypothetical protein
MGIKIAGLLLPCFAWRGKAAGDKLIRGCAEGYDDAVITSQSYEMDRRLSGKSFECNVRNAKSVDEAEK